ncbi:hypothetical protein ISCGN_008617 [Ixodes scapularis]
MCPKKKEATVSRGTTSNLLNSQDHGTVVSKGVDLGVLKHRIAHQVFASKTSHRQPFRNITAQRQQASRARDHYEQSRDRNCGNEERPPRASLKVERRSKPREEG